MSFSDEVISFEVTAYEDHYGVHPRSILACDGFWKRASASAGPFTGRSARIVTETRAHRESLHNADGRIFLVRILDHGIEIHTNLGFVPIEILLSRSLPLKEREQKK